MTRPIDREGILQKHWKLFVRDAVTAPHEAFAFDRSKATGQFSHAREAARGIRRSTPDTLLAVERIMPIWCEWKRPGYTPPPSDETFADQCRLGDKLMAIGHWWSWANDIRVYAEWIFSLGVEVRPNFRILAEHHQAAAESTIARAELKRGQLPKAYKPVVAKPTAARLRKLGAVRGRTMF